MTSSQKLTQARGFSLACLGQGGCGVGRAPSQLLLADSEATLISRCRENACCCAVGEGGKELSCWLRKCLFGERFNFMNKIQKIASLINDKEPESEKVFICTCGQVLKPQETKKAASGLSLAIGQVPPSWPLACAWVQASPRQEALPPPRFSAWWSSPPWRDDR